MNTSIMLIDYVVVSVTVRGRRRRCGRCHRRRRRHYIAIGAAIAIAFAVDGSRQK